MVDSAPDFGQRQGDGFNESRLLVQVGVVLAEHAELPRHDQGFIVFWDAVLAVLLHPLLEERGPIFQRLEHALRKLHIGVGAFPIPRQRAGCHLAAL